MHAVYVERLVDLLDPAANLILNMSVEEARERVGSGDPAGVREIDGQFALIHKQGTTVRMARSIGRPMRYFLAKRAEGPCLVVAERIDEIHDVSAQRRLDGQFHPSYTRMVPAHYVVELALIGCPDPNPKNVRFLTPQPNRLSTDLDEIGRAYIGALADEIGRWLDRIDRQSRDQWSRFRADRRAFLRRDRQRGGVAGAVSRCCSRAAKPGPAQGVYAGGRWRRAGPCAGPGSSCGRRTCSLLLEPIEVSRRGSRLSRGDRGHRGLQAARRAVGDDGAGPVPRDSPALSRLEVPRRRRRRRREPQGLSDRGQPGADDPQRAQ